MVETVVRRRRRRARARVAAAAQRYAIMGWPVVPGAHPIYPGLCSCDRVGCPAPGAHPVSPAWQVLATVDAGTIRRWWRKWPDANVLLVTGRVFDVLDVPARAGRIAIDHFGTGGQCGPVAAGEDRFLFFTITRGAPADEDEWWSCHLDCVPDGVADTPGLRWHCRESYVLAPPSVQASGQQMQWIREPLEYPLRDPMPLLSVLAEACEEAGVP
jgi:hypothetical protein